MKIRPIICSEARLSYQVNSMEPKPPLLEQSKHPEATSYRPDWQSKT